jgi:uncharacterized protein YktA (UPF0223 family)
VTKTKVQQRIYNNLLLGGRFRLTKVVRMDHKDDGIEVANKIYDYSRTTIEKLIKDGYWDALNQMRIQSIRDGIKKIVNNNTIGKSEYHMQQLEEKLQQIQMSINVEYGYDVTIKQTEDFISTVKSINDLENGLSLKEEKESLIDVAKRFIEIIKTKKPRLADFRSFENISPSWRLFRRM